jgi:MFS family permease
LQSVANFFQYVRQFGRFQRNARLYLLNTVLSGVTLGIILVLYNLYLVSLGYHTDFIGLVFFVTTAGAAIAIFPAGICVDRYSNKAILIWASLLIGVAGAGQMLFRSPVPLVVSVFFVGVGGAFLLVINAPFLTATSSPEERASLFSLNIVLTLATTVVGEALGGVLPIWFRASAFLMAPLPSWCAWFVAAQSVPRSYQFALVLSGIIALPSFIPLFMLSDTIPDRSQSRSKSGFQWRQVREQFATNTHAFARSLQSLRWSMLLTSSLVALIGVEVLIGLGAGLFLPYFNVYFVQHLGASSALFGLIDGAANTLNALATLLAPLLALRFGKVMITSVTRLLSIPLMLIIGLTGYLPLAAALYPFRQGLTDMTNGILQVFSMEQVAPERRGFANSSYQAAYQLSYAISASIGGVLIDHWGYAPVFIIAATLYMVMIVLLWVRFRDADRSPVDRNEGVESKGTMSSV